MSDCRFGVSPVNYPDPEHLDEQGLMYDLQHGFREMSCETQLVMLIEDLARNASVGKRTDIFLHTR